jgi:integrase
LRLIWNNVDGIFGALVKFLLLTGARRSAAAKMTWAELDGLDWVLPASRNKVKQDLVRPPVPSSPRVIKTSFMISPPWDAQDIPSGAGANRKNPLALMRALTPPDPSLQHHVD